MSLGITKIERTDVWQYAEFSHCLGLPIFYDTRNNTNYGMGTWDLMDQGSYNGNSFCPSQLHWIREDLCGWIDAIELNKAATVKGMKSSADYGKPLSSTIQQMQMNFTFRKQTARADGMHHYTAKAY